VTDGVIDAVAGIEFVTDVLLDADKLGVIVPVTVKLIESEPVIDKLVESEIVVDELVVALTDDEEVTILLAVELTDDEVVTTILADTDELTVVVIADETDDDNDVDEDAVADEEGVADEDPVADTDEEALRVEEIEDETDCVGRGIVKAIRRILLPTESATYKLLADGL